MPDSNDDNLEILGGYSTSMAIKEIGCSMRQLYYWEMKGIVHPSFERFGSRLFRRYNEKDISLLQDIMEFLNQGYNLNTAVEKAKTKESKAKVKSNPKEKVA